jgi:hypothetical protein
VAEMMAQLIRKEEKSKWSISLVERSQKKLADEAKRAGAEVLTPLYSRQ